MAQKNYAVMLHADAEKLLGVAFELLGHKSGDECYFLAHHIEPNGTYFIMEIAKTSPDGKRGDMELQIPHQYVKYVLSAADMKSLGFIQEECQ